MPMSEIRSSGYDDQASAAVIETILREIATLDGQLVKTLNARLHALAALRSYANTKGVPVVDANQEAVVLARLRQSSPGPLTETDLALVAELLCTLDDRHTPAS
jgi:chorismate mutase